MPETQPTRQELKQQRRAEREAQERAAAASATRKRRLGILAGVAALAVALVVALVALGGDDGSATPKAAAGEVVAGQADATALLSGIPQDGRTLGAATAPVTLVEFADVQCPFCAQFARDALPTIVRDYVRTGKVRLEFRPRAFLGDDSVKGAQLVVAAGRQDRLWPTLDLLYANQGREQSGWLTDDLATRVLRAAGADAARVRATAKGAGVARDLREADLLATRNGLDSTPSFLVGRTGGKLAPLEVQALTGAFFSSALDQAGA